MGGSIDFIGNDLEKDPVDWKKKCILFIFTFHFCGSRKLLKILLFSNFKNLLQNIFFQGVSLPTLTIGISEDVKDKDIKLNL